MKILLFVLLISTLISSNTPEQTTTTATLTVAVAANVQFAMEELRREFKKETGIDIKTVISSSGKLTAQIQNGAPFDVFLSANIKYPETLYKGGYVTTKPKVYAYGSLVLWTLKDLDLSKGIDTLTDSKVQKVAIANPKNAPYGIAAINTLNYYKIYKKVKRKLVYGESISQTNLYVASETADAGLTAKSVVLSPKMKGKGKWIEIDKSAYKPIAQGIVITNHGGGNKDSASQKFYNFLFSYKAKEILKKYGYIVEDKK
ncbi:MAG: molybdate ABC transporter substrate-binding protein [Candidatus Scalinduaceae bacterium]